MDIFIDPDGAFSLKPSWDVLIAILIIAIPVFFYCRWRLKKWSMPDKINTKYLAIATVLTTLLVYVSMVAIISFIVILTL